MDVKRTIAQQLYVKTGKPQKDIAAELGLAEKTISGWKKKFNWDTLRAAEITGPVELAKTLYRQIAAISDLADAEGRIINDKEADRISKLAAAIEKIEKKATLGHYVQVMEDFIRYIKDIDLLLAQNVVNHQLNFIQKKINKKQR